MNAAASGHFQPRRQLHKGGLATTRGPHNGDELAFGNRKVDILNRKLVLCQQLVVVGQPDIFKINKRHEAALTNYRVVELSPRGESRA